MSGPSDKAVERAISDAGGLYGYDHQRTRAALKAAHDPSLGLDRSVCLRDVVEFLRGPGDAHGGPASSTAVDFIEREFTKEN